MTSKLQALLNARADEQEKPKPLPAGHYYVVFGPAKFTEVNDTDVAEMQLTVKSAGEDVDQEELTAQGGIGDRKLRYSFWLSEDRLWQVTKTAQELGIDVEGKGIGQIIAAFQNQPAMARVVHKPGKNGEEIYANVDKIMAA